MGNTHLQPSMFAETQAVCGDILPACVLSESWPAAAGSMTLPAFATYGYCRNGTPTRLVYVNQPQAAVTLVGADGLFWLAIHADTHSAVASWTRVPGAHYLWRASATKPADPPGGLVFAQCTVAGGVVSEVDVVLHSYPRNRIPYGGATGALAYDQELAWDPGIKQVAAPQFHAYDYEGDNCIAYYTTMNIVGGENRWAFYGAGTAPSAFNGEVTAANLLHWSSWATGYQLRLGDHVEPDYTFDCNGDAILRAHVGIGVDIAPLPGEYHLNCGSANFVFVNTPELTATNLTVTSVASVYCPAQAGYNLSAQNIYSVSIVNAEGYHVRAASGYAIYAPDGGQTFLNGMVGIGHGPDATYWLRIPSIYADSVRATTALVDGALEVGGNIYAAIGAFGIGPQVGFYLTAANLYVSAGTQMLGDVQCFATLAVHRSAVPGYWLTATNAYFNTADVGGALGVASTLNVTGNTSLGNDLYVANRVGIGVSPVAGMHLALAGTGAQKPGGGLWADSSSRTMKRNIQRIPNALPLLLEQRGCMYEWQEETRAALLPGTRYGLVAEEVTLPQWRTEQEDGTVAIAANGFEALCIESLREIVTRLEALENARTD